MAEDNHTDVTALTVQLLSAFVSNNEVSSDSLADLIKTTRAALTEDLAPPAPATAPDYVPAVSVRKSLASAEHILSLIDGKPYKTLKRHLATHGLTEKEYRARYNLPASYPMVAPSYSEARRAVAQKLGFGRKRAANGEPFASDELEAAATQAPAKKAAAKSAPTKSAKPDIAGAPATANAAKETQATSEVREKAAAAPEAASDTANRAYTAASSSPKKPERKRLSISGPKDDQPASNTSTPAPLAAAENTAMPKKPAKAKATLKVTSLKAALGAASAHLKGGNKAG